MVPGGRINQTVCQWQTRGRRGQGKLEVNVNHVPLAHQGHRLVGMGGAEFAQGHLVDLIDGDEGHDQRGCVLHGLGIQRGAGRVTEVFEPA